MKFKIRYENSTGASEEYVISVTDYSTIEYGQLLRVHEICNVFLKDIDTNMWIRIPSVKVLRCFLSAVGDETVEVSIIFSESDVSPNQSRHSSPESSKNPDKSAIYPVTR
jgi:hypothetical protein